MMKGIFYLIGGVATNLLLFGPIDWSSWLSWTVFLLWPFFLIVPLMPLAFATFLTIVLLVWIFDLIASIPFMRAWSRRRHDARIRKFLKRKLKHS